MAYLLKAIFCILRNKKSTLSALFNGKGGEHVVAKIDYSKIIPKPSPPKMKNEKKYLFTSERLGFRNWELTDIDKMFKISSDPCIDIGWRIKRSEWNKGFATEGAERCLDYAFKKLNISDIYAVAPKINIKSQHIMTKIGMKKQYEFKHPLLIDDA